MIDRLYVRIITALQRLWRSARTRVIEPLLTYLRTCARASLSAAPVDAESDAKFQRVCHWVESFEPDPQVDYEYVYEYAQKKWEVTEATGKVLDEKSSKLFTLAAALAGVLFPLAQWLSLKTSPALISAFGCLLAATIYAVIAQLPTTLHTPFRIQRVLEMATSLKDARKNVALAKLSASMHAAIEGTRLANNWKADKLVLIATLICVGIACLIPLVLK